MWCSILHIGTLVDIFYVCNAVKLYIYIYKKLTKKTTLDDDVWMLTNIERVLSLLFYWKDEQGYYIPQQLEPTGPNLHSSTSELHPQARREFIVR